MKGGNCTNEANNLVNKYLNNVKNLYNTEKLKIFLTTIITSIIVHFQLYSLILQGPDTLINSMYHQADIWERMLLRFGLNFMQVIKGNIVSPILVTCLSSVLLGITVILVTEVLQIKNKYLKYITALVFAVAPNISVTFTFFYCSDAYIVGLLLATLAVFLIRKYANSKSIIFISGLAISVAMGMYQTYLSVAIVLCVATLIIDILNNTDKKQILKSIFRYILMGIVGIVGFYAISHIVLSIHHLPASDYSGANEIGLKTLINFPQLAPQAYQSFINYFFNDNMIPNTIWGTNIFYIIIFGVILSSIILIVVKNKIYKNFVNIILLLLLIAIAPMGFGIIEIMVPDVDIHILMACSMIYVFPIFFKILEFVNYGNFKAFYNKLSHLRMFFYNILRYIVIICSLIIAWIYMWQDNASYIAIHSMQNQTISTTERLVTRIEELDEYTKDMPVLLLGGLENNSYLNRNNTSIEAKKLYNRTWGFVSNIPTIWWGNLDSWNKILYEYLGVNLNLVSEWVSTDIFETEEYKSMGYYPEKDGIKIINGTVVVKLSD